VNVRLRIDRLVLVDGALSKRQVEALRRELGSELARLIGPGHADDRLSSARRAIPSISTRMAEPNADGSRIGRDLARTVHGALTSE
jgi:hypothetical protein